MKSVPLINMRAAIIVFSLIFMVCSTSFAQSGFKQQSVMSKKRGIVVVTTSDPVAIADKIPNYEPSSPISGSLKLAGKDYSRVIPDMLTVLQKHHPEITTKFEKMYRAEGIKKLASGEIDLYSTRTLPEDDELDALKAAGTDILVVKTASGNYSASHGNIVSLAVVVNESNPLRGLSAEQLDAVFSTSRNAGYPFDISKWKQLGVQGDLGEQPIHLYGQTKETHRSLAFRQKAMFRGTYKDNIERFEHQDEVAEAVAADPLGIGFMNWVKAYYPGVKPLAISPSEGTPAALPSISSTISNTYTLGLDCYFFVRLQPGNKIGPAAKEFLRVALSREGQEVSVKWRYLPLNGYEYKAMVTALD